MPLRTPVRGALLLGGASRRYGSPKWAVTVRGETLLARGIRVLTQATQSPPLLLAGAMAGEHPGAIADHRPGRGPLGGIETALRAAGCDVLVLAVDYPEVSAGLLHRLASTDGAAVVVPRRAGRLQPLCARWSYHALPVVSAILDSGRSAVMAALDLLQPTILDEAQLAAEGFEPARELTNLNRPGDLPVQREMAP